jgi:hypothetical protein
MARLDRAVALSVALMPMARSSPRLSGGFSLRWRTALILLGLLNRPANRT